MHRSFGKACTKIDYLRHQKGRTRWKCISNCKQHPSSKKLCDGKEEENTEDIERRCKAHTTTDNVVLLSYLFLFGDFINLIS